MSQEQLMKSFAHHLHQAEDLHDRGVLSDNDLALVMAKFRESPISTPTLPFGALDADLGNMLQELRSTDWKPSWTCVLNQKVANEPHTPHP